MLLCLRQSRLDFARLIAPLQAALLAACSAAPIDVPDPHARADGQQTISAVPQRPELAAEDGGVGDYFGFSLASSGPSALIGAPGHRVLENADQGAVYALRLDAAEWFPHGPPLTADDGARADWFGYSIAMSGDTAVVGAPGHQVGDHPGQGAAYVFVRRGAGFVQEGPALVAADGRAYDAFGSSVAISGDTIVVGAPARDVDSKTDQGESFVFLRRDSTWAQQGSALVAESGSAGDSFGSCVAISGNTVLVSAPIRRVGFNPYQGAAYVFVRDDQRWLPQGDELVAPDGGPFDQLGACALFGDMALLGAPFHTVLGNVEQGAAYIFVRSAQTWSVQGPAWVAPDGAKGDHFANSVALTGDTALIAAPLRASAGNGYSGSGYLFARTDSNWTAQGAGLAVDGGAPNELLGSSVALSENTALLGAPFHQVAEHKLQGAAYAFALERACAANCESEICSGDVSCGANLQPLGGCVIANAGRQTRSNFSALAVLIGAIAIVSRRAVGSRFRGVSTRV